MLSGWQGRLLYHGGRRELVKSVLSALPTYLLTILKPPRRFYKDLDKMRRHFCRLLIKRSIEGSVK
jgi:hypothetical protein